MSDTDATESNREKLLFDVMDYLKKHYNINERQITTSRSIRGRVSLTVHEAPSEFPGFGHSSVPVFEMSEEIRHAYIPRGNTLEVWTEDPE